MKKKLMVMVVVVLMLTVTMSSIAFAAVKTEAVKFTPKIDGAVDSGWDKAKGVSPEHKVKGENKATAVFKTAWDENNFYVLAVVKDPVVSVANEKVWEQDGVEFFLNGLNDLTLAYEADDAQYRINPEGKVSGGGTGYKEENLAAFAAKKTADGYIIEAAVKWSAHGVADKIKEGYVVGAEFQINDDDGSGIKVSQYNWSAIENTAWSDPSVFGEITLAAAPAAEKPAAATEAAAADANPKTGDNGVTVLLIVALVASAAMLLVLRKPALFKK